MPPRGFTLVELLVVLAVISITVSIVAFTWPGQGNAASSSWHQRLAVSRHEAVVTGTSVSGSDSSEYVIRSWTALPDGRSIVDSVVIRER